MWTRGWLLTVPWCRVSQPSILRGFDVHRVSWAYALQDYLSLALFWFLWRPPAHTNTRTIQTRRKIVFAFVRKCRHIANQTMTA